MLFSQEGPGSGVRPGECPVSHSCRLNSLHTPFILISDWAAEPAGLGGLESQSPHPQLPGAGGGTPGALAEH